MDVRRAFKALRFFFPSGRDILNARAIRLSGKFDRDFYLSSNPTLRRIFRVAPELHYITLGEPAGLRPNPSFCPVVYKYLNKDLSDPDRRAAFVHALKTASCPQADLAIPAPELPDMRVHSERHAPFAVVLHIFYRNMWEEFETRLLSQTFPFDLFITLGGTASEDPNLEHCIRQRFPNARIWCFPNHGRDILPFIHLVNSGSLAPYAAVCKIHSKLSPHLSDGVKWRSRLLDDLVCFEGSTHGTLKVFLKDPDCGIWTADGYARCGHDGWGYNRENAISLLEKRKLTLPSTPLVFPAGSMFWIKQALVQSIAALGLRSDEFEPEMGQIDGTTAHAVERLFGSFATMQGLRTVETANLQAPPPV